MEKRDQLIQFKVTKTEKETIQNVVEDLKAKGYQEKINASELARQGIEKWMAMYRMIEYGNSICYLPISSDLLENKKALVEIEDLLRSDNFSNHTLKILNRVVKSLEWEILAQLEKKYPNADSLYNLHDLNMET